MPLYFTLSTVCIYLAHYALNTRRQRAVFLFIGQSEME